MKKYFLAAAFVFLIPVGVFAMANPASVNCVERGGELELVQNADGGQRGECVFENGTRCEEWALMLGTCDPSSPEDRPVVDEDLEKELKEIEKKISELQQRRNEIVRKLHDANDVEVIDDFECADIGKMIKCMKGSRLVRSGMDSAGCPEWKCEGNSSAEHACSNAPATDFCDGGDPPVMVGRGEDGCPEWECREKKEPQKQRVQGMPLIQRNVRSGANTSASREVRGEWDQPAAKRVMNVRKVSKEERVERNSWVKFLPWSRR